MEIAEIALGASSFILTVSVHLGVKSYLKQKQGNQPVHDELEDEYKQEVESLTNE